MSCSKILSGSLPEITENIIKHCHSDYSTLHSCVLVNRLWCRLAIPLLWENPFSIPTGNYNFIGIYIHNLNSELKTKLNEYKINVNKLFSNTLFDYLSFIKSLNLLKVVTSVEKWLYTVEIIDLDLVEEIKELITTSLLKIFIENEIKLHTLEIEINSSYISYLEDILKLILQNPNFVYNIENLKLFIFCSNYNITLFNNRVLQVIKLHKNLKNIILSYSEEFHFYQSLFSSKYYNCSNTLNTITLYRINFKGMIDLNKMFEQLNVLESVHIIYCLHLNASFIQQILNLTKPFKLESLFIDALSKIDDSLFLLLQKSGSYLKNFRCDCTTNFEFELEQQIYESVIEYCENIKFLDIYGVKIEIVYQSVLNLIENIKQNLNCLSISCRLDNNSSFLLQNLGQILPYNLEYLDLALCIEANDFEVFLKNSKGTFINKLLIRDLKWKNDNDVLPYIKKYIMKEKRVRYLNFRNVYRELFDFSDEVKEFRLHNIKVQKYEDLHFDIYQFMQKLE